MLVFSPTPASPLAGKYFGPYTIFERVSSTNYIVNTPDRRKKKQRVHINSLKPYIPREADSAGVATLVVKKTNHTMIR